MSGPNLGLVIAYHQRKVCRLDHLPGSDSGPPESASSHHLEVGSSLRRRGPKKACSRHNISPDWLLFMSAILAKSGQGDRTALPTEGEASVLPTGDYWESLKGAHGVN